MAETITMPKLGFDMAEGTLVRWVKQEGETINKGEILAEIETDKATVEVESHAAGTVLRLLVNQGDVVPVSTPIAIIGQAGENAELPAAPKQEGAAPAAGSEQHPAPSTEVASAPATAAVVQATLPGPVRASPLARKMAQERGLDLGAVNGTGPGGRIVRRDVEAALAV